LVLFRRRQQIMKRFGAWTAVLALAFVLAAPALAGPGHDHGKEATMTGWISDANCGAKNANAEGAGCAKACIKGGAAAVLVVDGKVYTIKGDGKKYADHAGKEVKVTGMVEGDTIEITKVEPAKKA
jgi:hypothetical protein